MVQAAGIDKTPCRSGRFIFEPKTLYVFAYVSKGALLSDCAGDNRAGGEGAETGDKYFEPGSFGHPPPLISRANHWRATQVLCLPGSYGFS